PAKSGWAKESNEVATKKRKGEDKKKGTKAIMAIFKDMGSALTKPPEDNSSSSGPPGSNLSPHEQAILDSIDEKTRAPGFETTIRVITSSNVVQRAQSIQGNIVASFGLYNAPGKNGFKYTPSQDIESFVTAYIMRFFPQHHDKNILNSVELATIFHFPQQEDIPTTQLNRQDSKQVDGPRNVPEKGLLLGYNVFRGTKRAIRLALEDRQRHIYAVGQTGTGKSTFLENLALQDMQMGNGFAFIDPHGDTAERLLAMVPKERTEDVIYFCPADTDYPLGLNVFDAKTDDQKDFVIQEMINVLYKLYDPNRQGMIGARYESIFRNAALTVMAGPEGGSFIDIPKLFRDDDFVKKKLKHVTDQNVLDFWLKEMVQAKKSNEFGDVVSWFVSKFGAFLSNGMMRNIIGQTESSFELRDIMDNKKILLVNLSKGRTGDLNSNLLGMIFVMKFQSAAMSRANIPEKDRQDFCLYVDEFQNFSTDSFATILSEARKYRLNLVVANQFTTQLSEEIRDAVFGNVGTTVAFRVGQNDVDGLTRYFQPMFDADDLLRIPNYNAIVRTLIGGVPTQAFSMAGAPPLGTPNPELGAALKQLSAAKHGRPRQIVEKEIFQRMHVTETAPAAAKPAFGAGAGAAGGRPFGATPGAGTGPYGQPVSPAGNPVGGFATPGPAAAPSGGSSFLDQWLDKRRKSPPAAAKPPSAPPVSPVSPPAPQPQSQDPPQTITPPPEPKNDQTHPVGEFNVRGAEPAAEPGSEDAAKQHHDGTLHIKR
ncbi:MAG: type IV secretory system conjugative DNA transfer family protein, partial [Candidatus Saccharimonadales bacterium]